MKKVMRLLPTSIYDFPTLESWFSRQSEKGLFLLSTNKIFATFEKGSPQKKSYHLEPIQGEDAIPPKKLLESYGAFGWEYVTGIGMEFHIFVNAAENPMPLHTDPVIQGFTYAKMEKQTKGAMLIALFYTLYMLWNMRSLFQDNSFGVVSVLRMNLVPYLAAGLLLFPLLYLSRFLAHRQIKKQMQEMDTGSFPHERAYKKRHRLINFLWFGPFLCLSIMLYYTFFVNTSYFSIEDHPVPNGKIPFVTLAQVEGFPYEKQEEAYIYSQDSSLLDKKQFILRQNAAFNAEDGTLATPWLWMSYDALTFEFLAKPFYQAVIKEYIPPEAEAIPLSLNIEGLDEIQLYKDKEREVTYLFLRKKNSILSIHHQGTGDLLPYLDEFAALMEERPKEVSPFL